MALRKAQKEMAISLFVKAFSTAEDEKSRRELFIQFCDAFEGSIENWKSIVEKELEDSDIKEEFKQLLNGEKKVDIKTFVTIESLKLDDLEQISFLANKELGTMPWVKGLREQNSFNDFVENGCSFAAKRENDILGFILACKCPSYGGYYYMYIDTFVVDRGVQGCGIGKMLLEKVRKEMFQNRIYGMKLMTKREIPAYKIYKHLGFEETEDFVHMQRY